MKIRLMQPNGGGAVCLCDESGEPLPGQRSVKLISEPNDFVKIEVVFYVGGDVSLDRAAD